MTTRIQFRTTHAPRTVRDVNARLAARGVAERLVRGKDYYYFSGGTSESWFTSSVYVARVSDLSIDSWMAEYDRLSDYER